MEKAANPRELVLLTLLEIREKQEYCHVVLKRVLDKYQYLDKRTRAFITREVHGTLEHELEIDAILNQWTTTDMTRQNPVIAMILRSAVYELKYMDSVPDRATIDEAVKLAKKKGFSGLSGVVNGILRNISRHPETLHLPKESDPIRELSIRYSLPEWLVMQWVDLYGVDTVAKMGADFLKEKPTTIRFQPARIQKQDLIRRLQAEGVTVEDPLAKADGEAVPACALWISGYDYLEALPSFQEGLFEVQDLSSMQVGLWANPAPGDFVLDVCAAPGGKALHVAELLHDTGQVEARDVSEQKMVELTDNINRSGLQNIRARQWDARKMDETLQNQVDIVLADLPCSGLGTLGEKPDLKTRMTAEKQQELAALQRQILSVVQAYVKPGGKLLYSTCTVSRVENEDNVRWFLHQYPDFYLERQEQRLPGMTLGDGFFLALLRKGDGDGEKGSAL